jgi:hypothetical protein
MTLLSAVKAVCSVVGVATPTSVFSNIVGNRTMQEMLDLANEMAQRIAYDNREWTKFKKTATYAGDGTVTAFDLQVDYKRMLLTSQVWRSTSYLTPMRFVPDMDEWLNRRARNIYDAWGEWIIFGGQLHIAPVMGADITAYHTYLDKNCIALNSGGVGDNFMSDNDSFLLDERVLKLGMIWQWKANKGSPYAEDMGTYETALASVAGRDQPSPIFVGRTTSAYAARTAYPYPVPTP